MEHGQYAIYTPIWAETEADSELVQIDEIDSESGWVAVRALGANDVFVTTVDRLSNVTGIPCQCRN